MNRTYRSIWNDQTSTFVAVSEIASGAGKKTSSNTRASEPGSGFALKALAVSLMLSFGTPLFALPTDGVVAAGTAGINSVAGTTTVTQSTQNAIINWQSFGVGATEALVFVQPNSSSVMLNRVVGSDPSSILGSMTANGRVFIMNPNGVLFGKGASVNVGALVASTLNMADSDFMAGRYQFAGNSAAAIQNQGSISANGGYVALLGANVSNEGNIVANLGSVALAAGNAITLDVAGDGLLNVTVDRGAVNALVQNGGLIQADGGKVLMTAQSAGSLLPSAVNNTGVVRAQTLVTGENGSIMLMGDMQNGTVNVGGTLDASAPNGGNGGFIETSAAHVKIADDTLIRTQSAQGKAGTWLIDPVDFTIASIGGDITPGALATALGGNVTILSANGTAGTLGNVNVNNDVTWNTATTLTLNAVNDVNFNAAVTATNGGSLVAIAGNDIVVKANTVTGITSNGGNITWTAGRDIQVNANLPGQTGVTATFAAGDTGNITWVAGRDVNIGSQVTATGGDFTVCCGRDINVNATVTTTNGDVRLRAGRDIVVTSNMTTTDGNVLLRAGREVSAAVPGLIGGTVIFTPGTQYTVTAGAPFTVAVEYTPTSYATPNNYTGNFTGTGAILLTQRMLVFAQGNNKVYDGNTAATLSLRGNPTLGGDVSLVPGTATFDDMNVANNIGITYSGYTLAGADVGKFALWNSCLPGLQRTSANITPLVRPVIPVETLPVETLPVETLPVETTPGTTGESIDMERDVASPTAPTVSGNWVPTVVRSPTPPQLLALAPPVVTPVVAPVTPQAAPVVVAPPPVRELAPAPPPPVTYMPPVRPRKQDRN